MNTNITLVEKPDKPFPELTFPSCPICGTTGVYGWQESGQDNGFFAIVDVYVCPQCHPELIPTEAK